METIYGKEALPEGLPRVVAVGVFDGVHLGHQEILRRTRAWARERGAVAEVITFDRHPHAVVGDGSPLCITSLRHRLVLLERSGIQRCRVLTFDRALASLPALEFAEQVFRGALGVVMGYDQRFGRNREGGVDLVRQAGRDLGFDVKVVPPVLVRGQPVSSTALRSLIARGALFEAAEGLGRPFSVLGTVVGGTGKGRTLGFPTANLELGGELLPPEGVYRTETRVADRQWPSVANIGRRPTFGGSGQPFTGPTVLEVHLLGFAGDLCGREVEVTFLERMRDEVTCSSPEELSRLIAGDVDRLAQRIRREQAAGGRPGEPPSAN